MKRSRPMPEYYPRWQDVLQNSPSTGHTTGGDDKDPQVRIKESLKPEKLKLHFSPIQKVDGSDQDIFAASNLQYAPYQEQIGCLHMRLNANLGNHVSVSAQGDTPVMNYKDEDTCPDFIDEEFITTRTQQRQQRGQPLTSYINNMLALGRDADIAQL